MNLKMSVGRLPDPIRQLILTEPTIKCEYDRGERLDQILSCSQWANEWIKKSADPMQLQVLKGILLQYAGQPFELEALIKSLEEPTSLTGAEIRVLAARLRRSGILYAVRKAWGDQLLYLPSDNIPMWQSLLLPVKVKPLTIEDSMKVTFSPKAYRLPMSLELLSAWFIVYGQPIVLTAKGTLHRPSVSRMTAKMRLTHEELACLTLSYPQNEHLPAQAALALDLGMCSKVLRNEGGEINISPRGLKEWLSLTPSEADIRLYEFVVTRYGSARPSLHLIASAVRRLAVMEWYWDESLASSANADQGKTINEWLALLESLGWLERGEVLGKSVFRKKALLNTKPVSEQQEIGSFFVQPDGEIFVTPDTRLKQRWILEEISERAVADNLFVYRLTRNACAKAYNAGYTLKSVTEFLEDGNGTALPDQVARALLDWFSPLGKIEFAEVMLLRTDHPDVAARLMMDPEISEKLLEQVGDRDFIIDSSSYGFLRTKAEKIGYPPTEWSRNAYVDDANEWIETLDDIAEENGGEEQGWIYRQHNLSLFEADRSWPGKDELFPGVSSIPVTWTSSPRNYHASTRKELIRRAIEWEVPIQFRQDGRTQTFVPKSINDEGVNWSVSGQWRDGHASGDRLQNLTSVNVKAEEISEIMILLPTMKELETI
jgi:hypothetical protein